jgi:predicted glycosyltransferase
MTCNRNTNNHVGIERPKKIWIDLDNSPHVPFFKPIIEELERRGYSVLITARDCFQVCDLADLLKVPYKRCGRHYGKHIAAKVVGLVIRTLQLMPVIMREKPDLAVSHGSRSLFAASSLLRIPTITIFDYEYAKWSSFGSTRQSWYMSPELIPDQAGRKIEGKRVLHYPGIKEDVYASSLRPDPSIREELHIDPNDIVVTIRPPATEAHYHNPESEILLDVVFELIGSHPHTRIILLPRTPKQERELRHKWPELFSSGKVSVPKHVVDGMELIWFSDLVISGGGTMNREAAALGVPVYSIFRGTMGAVDKYLAEVGRLTLICTPDDVRTRIALVRHNSGLVPKLADRSALHVIVENIVAIAESNGKQASPNFATPVVISREESAVSGPSGHSEQGS